MTKTTMPVQISFGRSNSASFAIVLRLASKMPGYSTEGEGRDELHSIRFDLSLDDTKLWSKFERLAGIIDGWRTASVMVDDKSMRYRDLEREFGQTADCCRKKNERGDWYCRGQNGPNDEATKFGCRFLTGVTRTSSGYHTEHWYDFGTLDESHSTFTVDKEQIFNTLRDRSDIRRCAICPSFSWDTVRAEIDELPSVIDLATTTLFEIRYSNISHDEAIGIQPKGTTDFMDSRHRLSVGPRLVPDVQATRTVPSVRYADIGGQDRVIEEIRNVVELPLTHPQYFAELGVRPQRGILLYGPPGNGKTLAAKAVASESSAHLELINGPEILSMWVGQSEENLREAFSRASQFAPSVVLIDEIDSIAPSRDHVSHQHDVSLVSQLLVLMDGLEDRGAVAIIATTNRPDAIDSGILRPGRFDYHIEVPLPTDEGRAKILGIFMAKMKIGSGVSVGEIASLTEGFSGADLASLCREAGLVAIKKAVRLDHTPDQLFIERIDFHEALSTVQSKRAFVGEG